MDEESYIELPKEYHEFSGELDTIGKCVDWNNSATVAMFKQKHDLSVLRKIEEGSAVIWWLFIKTAHTRIYDREGNKKTTYGIYSEYKKTVAIKDFGETKYFIAHNISCDQEE